MADELRRDRSRAKFAQAITLYHIIIEATLAQPGQHFIEDFTGRLGTLPGFQSGMARVSVDEQRHIGFGVKLLSELFESEECRAAAAELIRDATAEMVGIFVPPGWDRRYTRELGFELEDIYAASLESLESRMRATGYPVEDFPPGYLPVDAAQTPRERAETIITLVRAGILGRPASRPDVSVEAQRALFDMVRLSVDHTGVGEAPLRIQWRFEDAAPWCLTISNGSTRIAQAEVGEADVVLRSTWRDWVMVATRQASPVRSFVTRRVKVRGPLRQLARMQRAFPS
jgi:hypothetical protein